MTLTKDKLKLMYLKTLYECQFGSMKGHSWGVDSIVTSWINKLYSIQLSPEEIQLTFEAIQEAKNSGLIGKDARQREDVFQILTQKGKELVEKRKDPQVYSIELEDVVKDPGLLERCLASFDADRYEDAILLSYKLVEESVRSKANLGPSEFV
jgi:hypothetical protein